MKTVSNVTNELKRRLLVGWLEVPNRKISKDLRFFRLRLPAGNKGIAGRSVQLVSRHAPDSRIGIKLDGISNESCVKVTAVEALRPAADRRKGEESEFEIEGIEILNSADRNLPFVPSAAENVNSLVRAQNRHIEMRSDDLASTLRSRYQYTRQLREALDARDFMEVETPILFKSTPEGAREFLVPTRKKGQFFALPQSPQQYKQILMAGGIHRYFQFARCFRDEDSRADRQLEFTQLDLEMSFVTMDEVMETIEAILAEVQVADKKPFWADGKELSKIMRMTYSYAMETYGSDKPDLRFGLRIQNIDAHIESSNDLTTEAIVAHPAKFSNKALKQLELALGEKNVHIIVVKDVSNWLKPVGKLGLNQVFDADELNRKLNLKLGDFVLLHQRDKKYHGGSTAMGQARLLLQDWMEANGLLECRSPTDYRLTWITDFPLFSPSIDSEPGQGGSRGLTSTHHPFTAPHPDDIHLLSSAPEQVRGLHYDLVMNGIELGGGSIRIHNPNLQRTVFHEVLGMKAESISQFDHLLTVLASGCPPHGGFAFGFDRLVAVLNKKSSIRDVIAFPKTNGGQDALIGSPSQVRKSVLAEYHLQVKNTD